MAEDPDEGMEVARLTLTYTLQPDNNHLVVLEAEDNAGEVPPLVTMLGMLELAKDAARELWLEGPDAEEDDDAEDD